MSKDKLFRATMKRIELFILLENKSKKNVKHIYKQTERTVALQAENMDKQRRLHKNDLPNHLQVITKRGK